MKAHGFSLIELMIVLVIVGGLVLLAAEGFRAGAARDAGFAMATELAGELRLARHLAVSRREPVRVVLHPEAGLARTEPVRSPGTSLRTYRWSERRIRFERLPRAGAVVFYPSGRAASPTTVTMVDHGGGRRHITVSLTGRVALTGVR